MLLWTPFFLENIAVGKRTRAAPAVSDAFQSGYANDDDPYSYYSCKNGLNDRFWVVDLGERFSISKVIANYPSAVTTDKSRVCYGDNITYSGVVAYTETNILCQTVNTQYAHFSLSQTLVMAPDIWFSTLPTHKMLRENDFYAFENAPEPLVFIPCI